MRRLDVSKPRRKSRQQRRFILGILLGPTIAEQVSKYYHSKCHRKDDPKPPGHFHFCVIFGSQTSATFGAVLKLFVCYETQLQVPGLVPFKKNSLPHCTQVARPDLTLVADRFP